MRPGADYWIEKLQLDTHVEGGSYRELYRSTGTIAANALPASFTGSRNYCTGIYFLLTHLQFSAFHRIKSDELWHFYYGDALTIYEIDPQGMLIQHQLGTDIEKRQTFQCTIRAGNWFASKVAPGGEYALVGCTVAPGFDFADFELANREELAAIYPQHASLIRSLTR